MKILTILLKSMILNLNMTSSRNLKILSLNYIQMCKLIIDCLYQNMQSNTDTNKIINVNDMI